MHSSRMRTTRTLTDAEGGGGVPAGGGACQRGGACQGGCLPGGACRGGCLAEGVPARGGIPCDLSHDAFDVTCLLPPHQLRHINCAAAYIVLPRCMLGYPPPPLWTESQTPVKT